MKNLRAFCFIILAILLPACLEDGIPQTDTRLANISNLLPDSGYFGDTIRLTGTQLEEVDSLFINGFNALIFNISNENLDFTVPFNSSTGPVSALNPYGISLGPDFTVLGENDSVPQPANIIIDSISPIEGLPLSQVFIYGSNFGDIEENINVLLDGQTVQLDSLSDIEIIFTVGANSTTGNVSIASEGDTIIGPVFTVLETPQLSITSINPATGPELTEVLITGENFGNQQNDIIVTLNGDETELISVADTEIVFIVPDGATTGTVVVKKISNGQEAEGPVFTVVPPEVISIKSIDPDSGPELTQVVITGENFGNQQNDITVTLNDIETDLISVSDTEIVFIIPDGATTGPVVVNKISNGQEAIGPVFTVTDPPLIVNVSTVVNDGVGNPFDVIQFTNFLLIADDAGHIIRLYDLNTNQFVATIGNGQAGFNNGPSAIAQFNFPSRMALDGNNNLIIADRSNHVIRGISGGSVSTISGIGQEGFADGDIIQQAQYDNPIGLAIEGSIIYVADFSNHAIRRIDFQNQQVTTIAGNGTPGFADGNSNVSRLNFPAGIALDGNGNLIIADYLNHSIRSLNLSTLQLTTLAGTNTPGFEDGDNTTARFNQPIDVDVDNEGNIYVADGLNHSIRMIANGATTTLAGTGASGNQNGEGSTAQFNTPTSVFAVSPTEILVGDYNNNSIKRLTVE